MAYTWFSSSGRLSLTFPTLDDARYCAHQGDCLPEVQETVGLDWMAAQLEKIDPDVLRRELDEYGAWDSDELANHDDNLERIVWLAANDVAEDPGTYADSDPEICSPAEAPAEC